MYFVFSYTIEQFENNEFLDEDAQFKSDEKEHFWRVKRSIDFNNCKDTVFLQVSMCLIDYSGF